MVSITAGQVSVNCRAEASIKENFRSSTITLVMGFPNRRCLPNLEGIWRMTCHAQPP